MSREKQIEEMAKDLQKSEHWYFDEKSVDFELDRKKTAENLYNAGYRKQSEGEWLMPLENKPWQPKAFGRCSVCNTIESGHLLKMPNFCPNCGAKMKGGA